MATSDYIGGIGGLMTMAALFAGNQQNQNNQNLMNLLTQSQEEETPIVPDDTGTIETIPDDQKVQTQVAPYDPDAVKNSGTYIAFPGDDDFNPEFPPIEDQLPGLIKAGTLGKDVVESYYKYGRLLPMTVASSPVKLADFLLENQQDSPQDLVDMYYEPETGSEDTNYGIDKSMDQLKSVIATLPDDHPLKESEMYENSVLNPEFDNSYAAGQRYLDDLGLSLPLTKYDATADADQAISYASPYSEKRDGETIYPLGLEIADIMQEGQPPVPGLELSNSEFNNKDTNEALREKLYAEENTYNELLNRDDKTFDYRNIVKMPAEENYAGLYSSDNNKIGLGVDKNTGEFRSGNVVNTILHEATHQANLGNDAPEEIAVRRLMETLSGEEDSSLDILEAMSSMTEEELAEFLKKRKKEGKTDIPKGYLKNILGGNLSMEDLMSGLQDSGFNLSNNFEDTFANSFNLGGRVQHSQLPPKRGPMADGVGSLFKQK